MPRRARAGGFTLVEVLVALLVMAVMAGLAWRGIDGLARAREVTESSIESTARLNTVMAQLEADLQAVYDTQGLVPDLSCDGATLRLTRSAEDGVQVVAWQLRDQAWLRWSSPAVQRAGDLQEHWMRSQQLLGNEPGQLRLIEGVTAMQVFFQIGNGLSNCQSSRGNTSPVSAVRIVLSLTQPRPGTLTRFILLGNQ